MSLNDATSAASRFARNVASMTLFTEVYLYKRATLSSSKVPSRRCNRCSMSTESHAPYFIPSRSCALVVMYLSRPRVQYFFPSTTPLASTFCNKARHFFWIFEYSFSWNQRESGVPSFVNVLAGVILRTFTSSLKVIELRRAMDPLRPGSWTSMMRFPFWTSVMRFTSSSSSLLFSIMVAVEVAVEAPIDALLFLL